MDDYERYLFDLQGYLLVENVLSPEELAALNATLDERIAADMKPEETTRRFGRLLRWGEAYRNLIDHPRIAPYLEELLGKSFRLDHDYLDVIRGGLGPIGAGLHGGGSPFDPSQYYHFRNGRMYNGLTVVAFLLKDVNPGDGGFGCVPGSHKINYPFPGDWRDLNRWASEPGPDDPPRADAWRKIVRAVTGPAGSAVIFTEALTHGTLPWRGADQRRTVFFKYSPHPISWSARYYNADEYEGLTETQKRILEAPNARYGGRY
jgi:ectoine hydroxylase-related dioxygenase (phytanoyl-CoA dioxygenase family)